jgi:prevent-host-death family protein
VISEVITCPTAAVLIDRLRRQVKRRYRDMTTVGFCEARTHLSELLDQAAKGKKVLITLRGKPAALIGPPPQEGQRDVREVVKGGAGVPGRRGADAGWPFDYSGADCRRPRLLGGHATERRRDGEKAKEAGGEKGGQHEGKLRDDDKAKL